MNNFLATKSKLHYAIKRIDKELNRLLSTATFSRTLFGRRGEQHFHFISIPVELSGGNSCCCCCHLYHFAQCRFIAYSIHSSVDFPISAICRNLV